jgi:anti-sigma B factor antagonist
MTSAPHGLAIDTQDDGDDLVVRVDGELDLSTSPQLSAALTEAGGGTATSITLDLSGVTFIDSSALRVLVLSGRALSQDGCELRIGARSEMVARVLAMTNLDEGGDSFVVLPGD